LCVNDMNVVVRAHEVVKAGYTFPINADRSVLNVFSCPNYAYGYSN
jgi:hypothetical protein